MIDEVLEKLDRLMVAVDGLKNGQRRIEGRLTNLGSVAGSLREGHELLLREIRLCAKQVVDAKETATSLKQEISGSSKELADQLRELAEHLNVGASCQPAREGSRDE